MITAVLLSAILVLGGCATQQPVIKLNEGQAQSSNDYLIGAGDTLSVFVWGNEELSTEVPVRPDGKITTPLVEDVVASGKTPTELAREMEQHLKHYIKNPVVTITVTNFVGQVSQQIRVLGQVTHPQSIPFRENTTLLDVIIAVGGLTEYASGNRAVITRTVNDKQYKIPVYLDNLIKEGDATANIKMRPGDILFVPETWF